MWSIYNVNQLNSNEQMSFFRQIDSIVRLFICRFYGRIKECELSKWFLIHSTAVDLHHLHFYDFLCLLFLWNDDSSVDKPKIRPQNYHLFDFFAKKIQQISLKYVLVLMIVDINDYSIVYKLLLLCLLVLATKCVTFLDKTRNSMKVLFKLKYIQWMLKIAPNVEKKHTTKIIKASSCFYAKFKQIVTFISTSTSKREVFPYQLNGCVSALIWNNHVPKSKIK